MRTLFKPIFFIISFALMIYCTLITILATISLFHSHPWVVILWFIGIIPAFFLPFFTHFCAVYLFASISFLVAAAIGATIDAQQPISSLTSPRTGMAVLLRLVGWLLATIVAAFFISSIFVGLGGSVALVELQFNAGPYTASGEYCSSIHVFYNDLQTITSTSPKSSAKRIASEFKSAVLNAKDPDIRTDLRNWLLTVQQQNKSGYFTAVNSIGTWLGVSCSSAAYKFPYEYNNPYFGFIGLRFH